MSQQAVRNYEAQGIIPPAQRRQNCYRIYEQRHLDALLAFTALTRAVGHALATSIMTAATSGRTDAALEALDQAHAQFLTDRETIRDLDGALQAASRLQPEPHARRTSMTIGELARHIGVTPTTLRSWERAGALRPSRHHTGHREYTPGDVHDARVIHLLRRGHFPLPYIARALSHIHVDGDATTAVQQTQAWRQRLNEQSMALLAASARLTNCLQETAQQSFNPVETSSTAAPGLGALNQSSLISTSKPRT